MCKALFSQLIFIITKHGTSLFSHTYFTKRFERLLTTFVTLIEKKTVKISFTSGI